MKAKSTILWVFLGCVTMGWQAPGSPMLDFIAMVETGATSSAQSKADFKRGRAGEVSRYQIKPDVWRRYTTHRRYTDPAASKRVAESVLAERQEKFMKLHRRAPNAWETYVLWNAPDYLIGERKGRPVSRAVAQRARYFANIVQQGTSP